MKKNELPIPPHYNPDNIDKVWKVPYQKLSESAEKWAGQYNIKPSADDKYRIGLLLVDVQNTFCIPEFELYVGGRSGRGAVDDNRRLCKFIYRNLDVITRICPTMDTHQAMQIFHSIFLINEKGEHPAPFSLISSDDIEKGIWRYNTELNSSLSISDSEGQKYLLHYVNKLKEGGKYDLTIWPYHAMLGGIGHALVSSVEEAIFFHCITRYSQPDFQIKGKNPLTEHYSVLNPEVVEDMNGKIIAQRNSFFIKDLIDFDMLIIAGQAKSHCIDWTVSDLLKEMLIIDEKLTEKVYLMEDCMSSVVVPGVIDYTDIANKSFKRFADAGMHIVKSTDPFNNWPGMK